MLPVIGHTPSIVFESHNPQIHGHITGSIVVRIIPIVIRLLDRTPPTQDIFGIDRFLPDALVTCEKCQREQSKQCNKTQIKSSPPLYNTDNKYRPIDKFSEGA